MEFCAREILDFVSIKIIFTFASDDHWDRVPR